jgi:DNA-3-methyladenine glycosylase II
VSEPFIPTTAGVETENVHRRSFELRPVGPFRLDLTTWALRRRARNQMDVWDGRYRRAVLVDGTPATIEVAETNGSDAPDLTGFVTMAGEITPARLAAAATIAEVLLGLRADLQGFYELADAEPRLRRLKDRFLGVHPPRFPTLFEALANAVANQQLTLEVGIELLNRFTDRFGVVAPGADGTLKTFPSAGSIAGTAVGPLRELGFSARKAQYLIGLAESVASGEVDVDELDTMDRAAATDQLRRLRGIGRWSAEYVLLRGLGRLDVFPGDDVGARNKLERFLELPSSPDYGQILSILEPWRPYAGLVYFHLLLDGLAERGALGSIDEPFAQAVTRDREALEGGDQRGTGAQRASGK